MSLDSLLGESASKHPTAFGKIAHPNEEWLAKQQQEKPLFADLPIIDTHHHLWDLKGYRYLIDEYAADIASGHNVVASVFCECSTMWRANGPTEMRPVGEVEFVLGQGAISRSGKFGPADVAMGIIGFADLTLGAVVEEVLTAEVASANGRLVGIRSEANWDADPAIGNSPTASWKHMLLDDKTQQGIRKLQSVGLPLDIWVYHPQLADVVAVADRNPDLTIVLNHCGGPIGYGAYAGQLKETFAMWQRSIQEVAKRPNVVCKVGGILSRSATFNYVEAALPPTSEELASIWTPWFSTCFEALGMQRCLYESNFPVEKLGTSYAVLLNVFKRILSSFSEDERQAFFAGNASRIYKLGQPLSTRLVG